MVGAWLTRRPSLPAGDVERGRWLAIASFGFVVIDALILGGAAGGKTSEPVLDLLAALGVFWVALLALDAQQMNSAGLSYSSFARRGIAAALWLGLVLLITSGYSGDGLHKGLFAACLAAAYPLAPAAARALSGVVSQPDPPLGRRDDRALQLRPLLASGLAPVPEAGITADCELASECLQRLAPEDIKILVGAMPGTGTSKSEAFGAARPQLDWFINRFPGISGMTYQERLRSFVRLVYETARVQERSDPMLEADAPSAWRLAASYCLERVMSEDPNERVAEQADLFRLRLWLYGPGTVYRLDDEGEQRPISMPPFLTIAGWDDATVFEEGARIIGGTINQARQKRRTRAIGKVALRLHGLWCAELRSVLETHH